VGGGACTFLEVVACIARDAFRGGFAQSPLFLNLENNMKAQTRRAAEIVVGAFGARLLRNNDEEFGWAGRSLPPSPNELAGRVVVRSKTRGAHKEYLDLLYFVNAPWGNFFDAARPFCLSSSLPENKVARVAKARPLAEINHAYLNRIYPKGTAVSSQNFNPLPFWQAGFQLVALNFQTAGLEVDVNRAMFARGGNSGFVLKPAIMRRGASASAQPAAHPPLHALREADGSAHDGSDGGALVSESNGDDADGNGADDDDDNDDDDDELDDQTQLLISALRSSTRGQRQQRMRRKSTGSTLLAKEQSSSSLLGDDDAASASAFDDGGGGAPTSLRLALPATPRGLPLASPMLTDSTRLMLQGAPALPKIKERPMLEERSKDARSEDKPRSKFSVNSVEVALVAVKNNNGAAALANDKRGGSRARWFAHAHSESHSNRSLLSPAPLHHHHDSSEEAGGEHVHVELAIDGDERDRVTRKSSVVCVRADQVGLFPDKEVLACILNDSERALFNLRLVGDDGVVRASRSFFAHCLSTGEFDLLLLGSGNQASYTLTLKCNCVYSYLNSVSRRHVLFDAEEPPLLPLPSKICAVELFVISARAEVAGLDLARVDPYVQVQVSGVPADMRDIRTPRVSNCRSGPPSAQCEWGYFPVLFTVSWSDFCFVRLSLRTFDASVGPVSEQKRARRGSISFTQQSHLIGRRTLWVEAIRSGYRAVQLFNQSERLVATLLCYFRVKDARAATFSDSERTLLFAKVVGSSSSSPPGGFDSSALPEGLGM